MTGYTVHTGASKKFVAGWDQIFGGDGDGKKTGKKSAKKKKPAAKASRKKAGPKKKK